MRRVMSIMVIVMLVMGMLSFAETEDEFDWRAVVNEGNKDARAKYLASQEPAEEFDWRAVVNEGNKDARAKYLASQEPAEEFDWRTVVNEGNKKAREDYKAYQVLHINIEDEAVALDAFGELYIEDLLTGEAPFVKFEELVITETTVPKSGLAMEEIERIIYEDCLLRKLMGVEIDDKNRM